MLNTYLSSKARGEIGRIIDDVVESKIPSVISKRIAGGLKDTVLVEKEVFLEVMNDIKLTVYEYKEEDESITLELPALNIISGGENKEDALENLIEDCLEYSEEYITDSSLYMNAPNRRNHLKYVILISSMNQPKQLLDHFEYQVK